MGGTFPAWSSASARPQTWRAAWWRRETLAAWIFLLPSLIGFLVFFVVPAVRGGYISLTDWDLMTEPEYVGLGNYRELLQDDRFWHSLRVTLLYVVLNIPLQVALALLIGVLMNRFIQNPHLRSVLILPWLMPGVVVALLFLWLLDPGLGIVNAALKGVGLPAQGFLGSVEQAVPSIAGINIWRHTGYTALLVLAGLQRIPADVYEAGVLDGASEWKLFRSITLPLLRPVLVFILITSVVGSFQIFDTIAVTTKGGPARATQVIYWYIYEYAFDRLKFGYAASAAFVLFLILTAVSLLQMRLLRVNESDLR